MQPPLFFSVTLDAAHPSVCFILCVLRTVGWHTALQSLISEEEKKREEAQKKKQMATSHLCLYSCVLCPPHFFFARWLLLIFFFLRCPFYPSIYLPPPLPLYFLLRLLLFKTPFTKHRAFACTSLSRQSSGFFFLLFFLRVWFLNLSGKQRKGQGNKENSFFFCFQLHFKLCISIQHILSWVALIRGLPKESSLLSQFFLFFFRVEQRRWGCALCHRGSALRVSFTSCW